MLKSHLKWHNDHCDSFMCDVCAETLPTKSRLLRHMCGHTGIFPYMCSVCSKGYDCKAALIRHSYVHTMPHKVRVYKKGDNKKNKDVSSDEISF